MKNNYGAIKIIIMLIMFICGLLILMSSNVYINIDVMFCLLILMSLIFINRRQCLLISVEEMLPLLMP